MLKKIIRIAYFGYGILIIAALLNVSGRKLGLASWYDVMGSTSFGKLNLLNRVWLILIYPLLLGSGIFVLDHFPSTRGSKK